jgi:putative transport protein
MPLRDDPVLVLFVVAGLGYLVGRLRIGGFGLGLSAVLFVGLGLSALEPEVKLPDFVYLFGLALFVYTTALACGPTFLHALRRRGLAANGLVVGLLIGASGLAVLVHVVLGVNGERTAGLFSGSLTNTPALAAVLEWLAQQGVGSAALTDPVVAYSLTYPIGVVGVLGAIFLVQRRWHIDYAAEASAAHERAEGLTVQTAVVRREGLAPLGELRGSHGWTVSFGRVEHQGHQTAAADEVTAVPGDLVTVVGAPGSVEAVVDYLGEASEVSLVEDRRDVDFRRIFVSDPRRAGVEIGALDLGRRFGAVVTRVRRGDVDMVAQDDTVLELGDRVRVVAPGAQMRAVSQWFGDSYRALSEVELTSYCLGMALGLLLGAIPVPTPGGGVVRLGAAGGTLVTGLVLGALHRTGPFVWQPPFSVSLTLRQIGTVMFLAGIGTRSGPAFASTLRHGGGVGLLLAGAVVTLTVSLLALILGYRVLKIPMGTLLGVVAGMQTQPAVLTFACEQTGDETPSVGYSTVYPVALVTKIVLAQFIVIALV